MTFALTAYSVELYMKGETPYYLSRGGRRATAREPKLWFRRIYAIRAAKKSKGVVRKYQLQEEPYV